MSADLSDVVLLLGGSVAVLAGLPLLYTWRRTSMTLLLLYVHAGAVLTLGGFLGAVFVVPLYGDVALLGGQLAYGGYMYVALLTVIVGRDVRVLRNIILLTIAVNVLKYAMFRLAHFALVTDGIGNPFDTSPEVFDQSIRVLVVGGALNLVELVLLLAALEYVKGRVPAMGMRVFYVLAFVGILALDGVLFPTLVLLPDDGLLALVAAGVQAKLLLAAAFAIPLAIFLLLNREDLQKYEATELRLSYLVTSPQNSLFLLLERQEEQLAQQRVSLDLSSARIGEAQATVESVLESAVNTVLVALDRDLVVTHFSAGARNTLGWQHDQVVGHEVDMLLDPAEVARQARAAGHPGAQLSVLLPALAASGARGDWALRTASGQQRMLSISVSAIDTDHDVVGYVLAGEDVTERLRATDALASSLEHEQESLARLQSAERLRTDMVRNVSHELSTPITSIHGYLEVLQHGEDLTDRQRDALDRALRNTARLRRLVDDLRLISEVDTGELPVDQVLDLRVVVASCREVLESALVARDLEVQWEASERPVLVRGDEATLREAVIRLIGNAVKFTPDGGRISVSVEATADRGVVIVSDTGIGIPAEDLHRIFGRFERGSEVEERAIQGAGLGLSIVSTVVRRHGGHVDVQSAPGEGTTVRVTLPALDSRT